MRRETVSDGGNNNDIRQMMLRYNQVDSNEYLYDDDDDDDCDDDDYDAKKLPQQELLDHTRRGRPPGLRKTAGQQENRSTPGFCGTAASSGSAGSGDEMCCGAGKTADRISRYISKRDEVVNVVENSTAYERRGN
jgi:hypothetical protein